MTTPLMYTTILFNYALIISSFHLTSPKIFSWFLPIRPEPTFHFIDSSLFLLLSPVQHHHHPRNHIFHSLAPPLKWQRFSSIPPHLLHSLTVLAIHSQYAFSRPIYLLHGTMLHHSPTLNIPCPYTLILLSYRPILHLSTLLCSWHITLHRLHDIPRNV